jgi:hypothetical protein
VRVQLVASDEVDVAAVADVRRLDFVHRPQVPVEIPPAGEVCAASRAVWPRLLAHEATLLLTLHQEENNKSGNQQPWQEW